MLALPSTSRERESLCKIDHIVTVTELSLEDGAVLVWEGDVDRCDVLDDRA